MAAPILNPSDLEPLEASTSHHAELSAADLEPVSTKPQKPGFAGAVARDVRAGLGNIVRHPVTFLEGLIPGGTEAQGAYTHGLTPEQQDMAKAAALGNEISTAARLGPFTSTTVPQAERTAQQTAKAIAASPARRAIVAGLAPEAAPLQAAEYVAAGKALEGLERVPGVKRALGEGARKAITSGAALGAGFQGANEAANAIKGRPNSPSQAVADVIASSILGGGLGAGFSAPEYFARLKLRGKLARPLEEAEETAPPAEPPDAQKARESPAAVRKAPAVERRILTPEDLEPAPATAETSAAPSATELEAAGQGLLGGFKPRTPETEPLPATSGNGNPALQPKAAAPEPDYYEPPSNISVRFHGSAKGAINELKPAGAEVSELYNLYGPGFYTTDTRKVAEGYAGTGGTLYEVRERHGQRNFVNLEKPLPADLQAYLKKVAPGLNEKQPFSHWLIDYHKGWNHYLDTSSGVAIEPLLPPEHYLPRKTIGVEHPESPAVVAEGLRQRAEAAGYAGFDYAGGEIIGETPHNVRIYFNPPRDVDLTALEAAPGASVVDVPVSKIRTAPEKLQYKLNYGREGAGLALTKAKRFNPQLAGIITLMHDPEHPGDYLVVNGHQRLDLARRTGQNSMRAQILPEGTTFERARAIGAEINMAETRGTAVDAAKYMRDSGKTPEQLGDEGIDLSEAMMQDAIALRSLADPLFRDVTTGRMRPARGVVIGHELPDNQPAQEAIARTVRDLENNGQSVSDAKLAEMIRIAKGSGNVTESQTDLFGTHQLEKSLAPQQADILTYVREHLGKDKRLFKKAAEEHRRLEQGGTHVDVNAATGISTGAAARIKALDATAYSAGANTNRIVRDYARQLANSPKAARAGILQDAYREIYNALERDFGSQTGLGGIAPEAGPGQGNLLTGAPMTAAPKGGKGYTELGATIIPGLPQVAEAAHNSLRTVTDEFPGVWDEMKRTFAPETRGPQAARAAQIIREHAGRFRAGNISTEFGIRPELEGNPIGRTLHALRAYFAKKPVEQQRDFIVKVQTGNVDKLAPELRPFAKVLRSAFDDTHAEIDQITDGGLHYRTDYFPNLWKERDRAATLQPGEPPAQQHTNVSGGNRSLEGGKGFTRARRYPTIADGLKAGLTPVFDNPVDLALAGLYEQRRFIMGQRIFQALKDADLARPYPLGNSPKGWARIDDKIARVTQYVPEQHGSILRGYYYAPEPAARVINNFLSPSLRSTSPFFRAWDTPVTMLNAFRVGMSAFHVTFTTVSDMALGVGHNMSRAVGALLSGDIADAMHAAKETAISATPYSVLRDYRQGSKIYRALIEPGSGGREFENAVESVIKAGGSFGSLHYDTFAHSLAEAWEEFAGETGHGLFGPLRYAVYQFSRPIMEFLVPRVKLGAFYRHSEGALADAAAKQGSELTAVQTRAVLQQTWDALDNVFGQLVRDNLGMKNALKDAMRGFVSFPGWNIGSGRIIGGVIRGGAKALRRMPLDPAARNSIRFAAGLGLVTALYGALLNRVMTGQWPHSASDLFAPRTGKIEPDGQPERVRLPSYLRDVQGLRHQPLKTVESKLNPLVQILADVLSNQNYYGDQIRNPQDSLLTQGRQLAGYAGSYLLPFAIQSFRHSAHEGPGAAIRSTLGINPLPRYLNQTPAEALLHEYSQQALPRERTPEQVAHSRMRGELLRKAHAGDWPSFLKGINDAIKAHQLTQRGAKSLLREAHEPPNAESFKHLTLAQAFAVYRLANASERRHWLPLLLSKWGHADPSQRADLFPEFRAVVHGIKQTHQPAPATSASGPMS